MDFLACYKMAKACLPNVKRRVFLKRLQFASRLYFRHAASMKSIEAFFAKNSVLQYIMARPKFREHIYKQQVRTCFFQGSKPAERVHFLTSHFTLLEKTHKPEIIKQFYDQTVVPFVSIEGENKLALKICYDQIISREGLLWLLVELNDVILYKITFWLMDDKGTPTLCIGALQGGQDTLETNRVFTKDFWGLRPQNMAITALRWYAQSIGVQQVLTFPRDRLWCKKISDLTALDEFWEEQGGKPVTGTPFIKLALDIPPKDLSEVATRKRSMYRKRYEFLDKLHSEVTHYVDTVLKK